MAKFLTTKEIGGCLERMFRMARRQIYLVSPYLSVDSGHLDRLRDASTRGVKTIVVCRGDSLKSQDRDSLLAIRNLKLHGNEVLHAKCFMNESMAVVGSMNLYEYSERNNREMGILIERSDERPLFEEVFQEVQSLVRDSKPLVTHGQRSDDRARASAVRIDERKAGWCIRCRAERVLDPRYPFCEDCYKVWAQFCNPDWVERYCHVCGSERETSMRDPLCGLCKRQLGHWQP